MSNCENSLTGWRYALAVVVTVLFPSKVDGLLRRWGL